MSGYYGEYIECEHCGCEWEIREVDEEDFNLSPNKWWILGCPACPLESKPYVEREACHESDFITD